MLIFPFQFRSFFSFFPALSKSLTKILFSQGDNVPLPVLILPLQDPLSLRLSFDVSVVVLDATSSLISRMPKAGINCATQSIVLLSLAKSLYICFLPFFVGLLHLSSWAYIQNLAITLLHTYNLTQPETLRWRHSDHRHPRVLQWPILLSISHNTFNHTYLVDTNFL